MRCDVPICLGLIFDSSRWAGLDSSCNVPKHLFSSPGVNNMLDLIKATTFDDAFPQGMFLLLGVIDVVAFKLRDTEFRHAPVGIKVSRLERISDYAGM